MSDQKKPTHSVGPGKSRRLSPARRLVADFLHACRDVPLITIERRMNLDSLVRLRDSLPYRISWVAIFIKAWSRIAERRPELRQLYMPRPIPRIYEHRISVATVVVERIVDDEPTLLLTRMVEPSSRPIREIDAWLKECKVRPVAAVRDFRHNLRLARWPWLLRRAIWDYAIRWRPTFRANRIGTFGISVTAGFGAATLTVRHPWTTCLHYGTFEPGGILPMRMTFDHRVFDGATAARALCDLEEILLREISDELNRPIQAAA